MKDAGLEQSAGQDWSGKLTCTPHLVLETLALLQLLLGTLHGSFDQLGTQLGNGLLGVGLHFDVLQMNLILVGIYLPGTQIELGQLCAVQHGVAVGQEEVSNMIVPLRIHPLHLQIVILAYECLGLCRVHLMRTTEQTRQRRLANALQLLQTEGGGWNLVLVPEAIGLLEQLELLGQQAANGGSKECTHNGILQQRTHEQINVLSVPGEQQISNKYKDYSQGLNSLIDVTQIGHMLLGYVGQLGQILEGDIHRRRRSLSETTIT